MSRASAKKSKEPRTVQSVDRAVAILETLVQQADGLNLSTLAEQLGLAPQTAQSLVRTLQTHGLVAQNGRGQPYTIGPKLPALAQRWLGGSGPAALARNAVLAFSAKLGEYALLAELRGALLMPLCEVRAERTLMANPQPYDPDRLHTMATAKVLLAALPRPEQEEICKRLRFTKRGPRTITDPAAFLDHLVQVSKQGYAVCREETGSQVVALAVPVRDASGKIRAALGTTLPLPRCTKSEEKRLLQQLKATATEIAKLWGA